MNTRQLMPGKPATAAPPSFPRAPSGRLQRKCACSGSSEPAGECGECAKKLQRRTGHSPAEAQSDSSVPPIVHEVLGSPGRPLEPQTRAFMEPRFGHDFSRVRVHTDGRAAASTQAVNALAYTVGQNVVFGDGQYAPQTSSGRGLLAHELAHVLQQQSGSRAPIKSGSIIGKDAEAALEREADAAAEDRLAGRATAPSGSIAPALQRYSDPIPRVQSPTVVTMEQFILLVGRIEAANATMNALQIAQMIMRTKYHSRGFDYLLPSSAGGRQVSAQGAVTASDVTTLSGEFEVTLPQGGQSDPTHVVTAIVAGSETQAPGAGGAGGVAGRLVQALPGGLSQRDVATWVGDVASAAAEWHTAHPHPSGGTTKQNYMDEYAPESDLIADVDGVVMTSRTGTTGFAFDPSASLSSNLRRFYFPTAAREGKNRRFHGFCAVEGFGLAPDGLALSRAASGAIDNRVQLNTDWFERNDPNLVTWVAMNSEGLINPIRDAWIDRANDWHWFSERFRDFVQRNLRTEGA